MYGKGYGQCEGSKYGQNAKSQKYAGSQNKGRKRKKDPTCIQLADKKKWKCNLIHGLSKHPGHRSRKILKISLKNKFRFATKKQRSKNA